MPKLQLDKLITPLKSSFLSCETSWSAALQELHHPAQAAFPLLYFKSSFSSWFTRLAFHIFTMQRTNAANHRDRERKRAAAFRQVQSAAKNLTLVLYWPTQYLSRVSTIPKDIPLDRMETTWIQILGHTQSFILFLAPVHLFLMTLIWYDPVRGNKYSSRNEMEHSVHVWVQIKVRHVA